MNTLGQKNFDEQKGMKILVFTYALTILDKGRKVIYTSSGYRGCAQLSIPANNFTIGKKSTIFVLSL